MAGYACGMNIKSHILVSPGQLENEILSQEKTEKIGLELLECETI